MLKNLGFLLIAATLCSIAGAQSMPANTTFPNVATTPSVGGPPTVDNNGSLITLHRIAANYWFGDSYNEGLGLRSPNDSSYGKRKRDVPAPMYNYANSGDFISQFAQRQMMYFVPSLFYPTVTTVNGPDLDALQDGYSTSTPDMNAFKLSESELLAWGTIPFSNRKMASTCTKTTGTWTTNNDFPLAVMPFTQPGTAMQTSTSGNVLTCSITTTTATTEVGFAYNVYNGGTGTMHVSVDGTNYTDLCSGTTTITSAPCVAYVAADGQTKGTYRQEATVTPATSHTVVFTTTNAAEVTPEYVDWIVPNAATNNVVFQYSVPNINATALTYNSAESAVLSTFISHGLQTYYMDLVNGIAVNGTTYSFSFSTDTSTTETSTCAASLNSLHPNNCGAEDLRKIHQAAEYFYSWQFSSPNLVANESMSDGYQQQGPYSGRNSNDNQLTAAATINLNSALQAIGGLYHITGGTTITTITPPPSCQRTFSFCQITFIADSGLTFATGGNIATGFTMTTGQAVVLTFEENSANANVGTPGTWYPSR